MKALSLWQPWATAIALGSKRIETRSWKTDYRGPLAIHAAKNKSGLEVIDHHHREWRGALRVLDFADADLPYGVIVAICRLVACRPIEELVDLIDHKNGKTPFQWTEEDMGDFSPGRFGWILEDIRQLVSPIPYRGQQGLFDVVLTPEQWHDAGKTAIRTE